MTCLNICKVKLQLYFKVKSYLMSEVKMNNLSLDSFKTHLVISKLEVRVVSGAHFINLRVANQI